MLKYEYIPKNLIVSRTARKFYRVAAVFSWVLAAFLVFGPLLPDSSSPWMLVLMKCLVLLGVLGAGVTLVAMELFFFGFSESSSFLSNLCWFVVMAFVPLGPPIYCFVVYSRSKYFRNDDADRVVGATTSS